MQTSYLLTAALVALLLPCFGWADDAPQARLYEMKVNMTGGGFLGQAPREHTNETCISPEEFAQGPDAFTNQNPQQECELANYQIGDGKISLAVTCSVAQGIEANMAGSGSYDADSFEMTNQMTMKSHGLDVKMYSQVVGKRIGDC